MDLLDLAIIYLACGAPFAVQYSFRLKDRGPAEKSAKCILAGLAWPVFAVIWLTDAFKRLFSPTPANTETRQLIDGIRESLESSVDLSGRPDAAFEFRRTVLRWAELAVAVKDPTRSPAVSDIWEITEHSRPDLASASYIHRETRLIDAHFEAARGDLINLATSLKDNIDFRSRAITAAKLLNDDRTLQALTKDGDSGSAIAASAQV